MRGQLLLNPVMKVSSVVLLVNMWSFRQAHVLMVASRIKVMCFLNPQTICSIDCFQIM